MLNAIVATLAAFCFLSLPIATITGIVQNNQAAIVRK